MSIMDPSEINDLKYVPDSQIPYKKIPPRKPPVPRKKPFIKGPIDLEWISAAASLPGKALHVALALMWVSGLKKSKVDLKLTRQAYERFHVSRKTVASNLHVLEKAGLIRVTRSTGKKSLVTILDAVPSPTTKGKEDGYQAFLTRTSCDTD